MKKLSYTGILLLLIIACSKDYLNEPKPTASASDEIVFNTRSGVEAFISGILRLQRTATPLTSVHRSDAAALYSIYMARSMKGKDLISDGWYMYDYQLINREPGYVRTRFTWEFPYMIIKQANILLEGIENSDDLSESDKEELAAQGYALRGFYYFQLAQEFQLTYTRDPNAPAPPIYTKPTQKGGPMRTLEDMYALITQDLEKAFANVRTERLGKSYINKNVVAGMLARVYQVMGGTDPASAYWPKAERMAKLAYGDNVASALDAQSYRKGFDDIQNKEWIWGMPQSDDQKQSFFTTPSVFSDPRGGGYACIYIDKDFVNSFSDADVRRLFIEDGNATPKYKTFATEKFKFSFDADMVLMRTAEMILIEAEAEYWQGKEGKAHGLLHQLQENRDPNAVKSSNTGTALLDEILLERRKELYLEIGTEWYDARRLQRGIKRSAYHPSDIDLAPNDKRFYLKVPQEEIDANDQIDESVNANR